MSVVGVIPARLGNGKNLRLLGGEPLLAWTLAVVGRAALDQVVVTSEDHPTRVFARCFGVATIERPAGLALDTTPDLPVFLHALEHLRGDRWTPDDLIVVLRPTAPFRTAAEIDAPTALLRQHPEASSVRSVIPARHHPRKCYRTAADASWRLSPYTLKHAANAPRQGLEKVYAACGFIDVVRATTILGGSMEGESIVGWGAPVERAIDLDDEADWRRAEALIRERGWRPGEILPGGADVEAAA